VRCAGSRRPDGRNCIGAGLVIADNVLVARLVPGQTAMKNGRDRGREIQFSACEIEST
jgi:hypothetical protein